MIGQGAPNCACNSLHRSILRDRAPTADIYDLVDDLLLKIFYHCRPLSDEIAGDCHDNRSLEARKWENVHWWYNLAHVCRRWRRLVLASGYQLGLCLLCTYNTPVADMLMYPPAFPLIIDYSHGDEDHRRDVTARDEEGVLLALRRRRRVRRIRFCIPAPSLQRLLAAMDGEFPMLENLYIKPLTDDNSVALPASFNAPHLRHFVLRNVFRPLWMFCPPQPIPHIPSTERSSQSALYHGPQSSRSPRVFVHILDDDSLLDIFRFCRPDLVDEGIQDQRDTDRVLQGGKWDRERWWYRLANVCQRWRRLIHASASHLKLCLVCVPGTPVADMLENSPPLPLIIDHIHDHGKGNITAKDEEGIRLALQHRDRVRRIRLRMSPLNLEQLVRFMDGEFPMLEYLYINTLTRCNSWLTLPDTFQASRLHHLISSNFTFPMRSPLIMNNTGLVTLSLQAIAPSTFPHPNDLLQQLALMPHLKALRITFHSPVPKRDLERQLMHRPVTTRVTLPNLRWLGLRATSTYMEALLSRMTTPLLERLEARFFLQLNISVPRLLEFMGAAENLKFYRAKFQFSDNGIYVHVKPRDGALMYSFIMGIACGQIDWQVSFAVQLFRTLRTVSSAVEQLTLKFQRSSKSSEMSNNADRIQWRELLGSFSNVKSLRVSEDFRGQISRSLQVNDGESPLELLSELTVLQFPRRRDAGGAFTAFINARQDAGRPVAWIRY